MITEEKPVVVLNDSSIEDAIELVTAIESLDAEIVALEDLEATFEEGFEALANIQRLHDNIAENGISRPLMAFADPNGYLTEHLGLPALEDLDITPIKDANTECALEALSEKLKKWAEAIRKFFKMIVDGVKAMMGKVVDAFKSYEKILVGIEGKLKGLTLDAEKAKEQMVTCIPAADLGKLAIAVSAGSRKMFEAIAEFAKKGGSDDDLKALLAGFDDGDLKMFGLKVNAEGTGLDTTEYPYEEKEDSVVGHGLDVKVVGDAIAASKVTATRLVTSKGTDAAVVSLAKAGEAKLKSLEALSEADDKAKETKSQILNIQKALKIYNKLNGQWVKKCKYQISQSTKMANAVIAAGAASK